MDELGFNPQYDDSKYTDIIYVGESHNKESGGKYRKVELIINEGESYLSDKNAENKSISKDFKVVEDEVLYATSGGQQKIHCWLIQSDEGKGFTGIRISRRTKNGVYGCQEITLNGEAIKKLKKFLDNLHFIEFNNTNKYKVPINDIKSTSNNDFSKVISNDQFKELINANITSTDDFYTLLTLQKMKLAIEELKNIINGDYKNEVDIQKFLKQNIWMFGNDYVCFIDEDKIDKDNILDMISGNFESFIDVIEVKLPKEELFNFDNSHKNYYPNSHLTKAISQTQNYIYHLENKSTDKEYQARNNCKILKPRGIILYGSGKYLTDDEMSYLRILNTSYHNIKILTYQQLYKKAKNTLSYYQKIYK